MRLVDFQAFVRPVGLSEDEQRSCNEAFFPLCECVRFWLRENRVEAPFRKILVTVVDEGTARPWHGKTSVALGVCEVTEAVQVEELKQRHTEFPWLASIVVAGLRHIESGVRWSTFDLVELVRGMTRSAPPCVHRFAKLRQEHKGTQCDLVFRAGIGASTLKVEFTSPHRSCASAVIAEAAGPLFLDDVFPVAASGILGGDYVLRDRERRILARVPIPVPASSPPKE